MSPGITSGPLITAKDLRVSVNSRVILRGLTFSLPCGQFVGILGPNGSGKTTLLRSISGTQRYTGHLTLAGKEVHAWTPRALARFLAFVRQTPSLTFDFTVEELVLLGRSPHKTWLETYTHRDFDLVHAVLADVGLSGFEDRSVLTLSGGELQRAFLAQALTQEAKLLLLDEPTAHLDIHYQFDLMERLRKLISQGFTVIAVFHDLELAGRFADHLLILRDGELVTHGSPIHALTPDLIASVFQMEAVVEPSPEGWLEISYIRPLSLRNTIARKDSVESVDYGPS